MLRFAIPSKGSLHDSTVRFLDSSGLAISRPNPRRYTASIRTLPGVEVLLHRATEIVEKVAAGTIDAGISGFDLVQEYQGGVGRLAVAYEDLGFGRCELVLAVPTHWVDVSSVHDLADLAAEFASQGRQLRIATKFPGLVRDFCHNNGINVFLLVASEGATEAAPELGYTDIIADLTASGATLRDNNLKMISGGTLLQAQACFIVNREAMRADLERRELVHTMLELFEARRRASNYATVNANVPGESVEDVGRRVVALTDLAGIRGPTIAPVFSKPDGTEALEQGRVAQKSARSGDWYAISVVVEQARVLPTVRHLRSLGGSGISVLPVQYVFFEHSEAFARLQATLNVE